MFTQIIRTADRNLLVRAVTPGVVVYDVVFTKNDALDVAEAASEGFSPAVQRNPNRFCVAPLDAFVERAARNGVYLQTDDRLVQGQIDKQISALFA